MNVIAMRPQPSAYLQRNWVRSYWFLAILTLLVLQLSCGTKPEFAFLVALFCVLTYLAVKRAGGPATLMGFCTLYLALQNVIISQIAKVVFWEPGDSLLLQPIASIGVYVCAMSGIYLAAMTARRLGMFHRRPLFAPITDPTRLMWISYISTALFLFQMVFTRSQGMDADTGSHNFGGVMGLLHALPFIGPLAVASGTAFVITASKGRRSFGFINSLSILLPMLGGVLGASREGITSTAILYFVTCWAFGFRFRFFHYSLFIGGVFIAQYILFPYALYARATVRTPDVAKNFQLASNLLLDVISDPAHYQPSLHKGGDRKTIALYKYYDKPNPSLDRFTMIKVTDALVNATLHQGTTGMDTITPGFLIAVPRFLIPDKPYASTSNTLAHRAPGLVGRNDHTTGITTGFTSDAFSSYGWLGAFLIPFLLALGLFCPLRYVLLDNIQKNIFALSLFLSLAHSYSEAPIAASISGIIQGPIMMILTYGSILYLASFAMRTQEKILTVKHQAVIRDRAEVLGWRLPTRRRLG